MTMNSDEMEMFEGDVMLSRNRMVVVIYDATLERTTNGKGLPPTLLWQN
jgi:glycerophosphoryl diester phosphodiesterase